MRFSVVMATWQGERYLPKQLATLRGQTRLPDELIVVDDGSEDGTLEILEDFAASAPFPVEIVRSEVRSGSTTAFGVGIARATGDLIALADQDDLWLPQKLARLESVFLENPGTTFAFSDALLIDEGDIADTTTMWQVRKFTPALQDKVRARPFAEIAHRFLATGCTIAFRADLRDVVLPFPTDLSTSIPAMIHDRWISIVLSGIGTVAVINEPLVAYRVHASQQVGLTNISATKPPMQRYLGRLLTRRRDVGSPRLYQLAHLVEARDRLVASGLAGEPALAEIDAVIRHQSWRCQMKARHLARVVPIARELALGRYHQYSRGWSSAVLDLLERHVGVAPEPEPARPAAPADPGRHLDLTRASHARDTTAADRSCRTVPRGFPQPSR